MTKTFSGVPGDSKCECSDGHSSCELLATTILYRTDMTDRTGTAMCEACANNAFDCGLFTDEVDDSEDTELTGD